MSGYFSAAANGRHKANKAMKVSFIAATIPPPRSGASVGEIRRRPPYSPKSGDDDAHRRSGGLKIWSRIKITNALKDFHGED